jgi:hypothetical protein
LRCKLLAPLERTAQKDKNMPNGNSEPPILRDIRRKLGSFGMMSLVRVGFSSKLQVGFNCSLVPNVAKNMADLININKCIFIPYFAGRLGHLKGG